jgi:glutamine synthetase
MGRRKISLTNEDSRILSVRVPASWIEAFKQLETEDIKQQVLVRRALRNFLRANNALPSNLETKKER